MITFIITNKDINLFTSNDVSNSYFKHMITNNILLLDYQTYITNINNLNIYDLTFVYHNLKLNKTHVNCIYNKDILIELSLISNLIIYGNELLLNEFKGDINELIIVNYTNSKIIEFNLYYKNIPHVESYIYKSETVHILKYKI